MAQINSGSKQPVSFVAKDTCSSMAIALTDRIQDASWRLRVEAEIADGGRYALGAVDTIQPRFRRIRNPNAIVAVCSVPGVRNWYVYYERLTGTPTPGHSEIYAEMKLTAAPEYAAGCCPLVAVPGESVNLNEPPSQSPNGGPLPASRVTLYTGPGFSVSADIAYLGAGEAVPAFVQQHDAGASDAISTATMIGPGFPVSTLVNQLLLLEWSGDQSRRRRFTRGYTFALSTTQIVFTASPETIAAWGQWGIG